MWSMSQLNKVLQVLDVFTEQRPFASAEEVAGLLAMSRTTAFRHLAQLCESGLLTKMSGRYSLGARIIQLDHLMRRNDPLLLAAREPMGALEAATRCSVVLSSLYGEQILNVHHEAGADTTVFSHGRGRTLPLFRGAASMIILAHLTPARLKSLFQQHEGVAELQAIGCTWESFSERFRRIRRDGFYISHGEVDPDITGIAVPVFSGDGPVAGSLSLVFESQREDLFNTGLLVGMLRDSAGRISEQLHT